MRKLLFCSLFIAASFIFCGNSFAQELAKPVPEKTAVKQKVEKSNEVNSNDNSNSTKSQTKAGSQKNNTQNSTTVKTVNDNPYNATRDSDDYQSQKAKWISENPEKYKAYSGNPNLVIMTEAELQQLSAEERNRILADEVNFIIIK